MSHKLITGLAGGEGGGGRGTVRSMGRTQVCMQYCQLDKENG